ncbi:MAG: hypothetical protein QM520_04740, partial [Gammaproteobacteria bacterium]|nr:hypothetical protein [Gammaproteobacteria bacterium]
MTLANLLNGFKNSNNHRFQEQFEAIKEELYRWSTKFNEEANTADKAPPTYETILYILTGKSAGHDPSLEVKHLLVKYLGDEYNSGYHYIQYLGSLQIKIENSNFLLLHILQTLLMIYLPRFHLEKSQSNLFHLI